MRSDPTFHRSDPRPLFNVRPTTVPGYDLLVKLIGKEACYQWASKLPREIIFNPQRYEEAINSEIDRLTRPECTCAPDGSGSACPVCKSASTEEELRFA